MPDKPIEESEKDIARILYKLGQIETKMEIYRTGWSEPVRRIEDLITKMESRFERDFIQFKVGQKQLEDANHKMRDDIHAIKNTLQYMEKRFTQVEENTADLEEVKRDISIWKVRFSTIIATVVVAWAVLGDTVSSWLARVFN